jgi:hypothetical protein
MGKEPAKHAKHAKGEGTLTAEGAKSAEKEGT